MDFDGTMGDTRDIIVKTMQQTICELKLEARTDDECAAMIGLPLKETFTKLLPISDEMGERCAETYGRLFSRNNRPGAVKLFPHVLETVNRLYEKGTLLTIASSRSRTTLLAFLEDMDLKDKIPYVVSADDIEHAKPAPDMVVKTLKDCSLQPKETLVVGDTTFDIEMAHRAGVKGVGVTYGNGTLADMETVKADYVISDFSQLMDIVEPST